MRDTTFADYLLFTYRRTDQSVTANVVAACEVDADLVGPWTLATEVAGTVIQVADNFYTRCHPASAAESTGCGSTCRAACRRNSSAA